MEIKPPQIELCHDSERNEAPHSMRSRKMIGKYYLYKTVGRGSTGKVKLAINTETNKKVAVKMVSRKLHQNSVQPLVGTDESDRQKKERAAIMSREIRTVREASIMTLLNHPNIAFVEELMLTADYYYLVMEYVDGGQLLDYIISHGKLKEKQARQFSRQIASALDYCHRNSVVHRDLKVENILISRKGLVKIIDFGLSNVYSPKSQLNTFCGSLYFAAPELLDGKTYTGPEVDVWSFGVVIYVLVCGQVPFDDPTMSGMHAKVKKGHVEYPSHLSSDCKHLLKHMLVTNSKNRLTMSDIIVHPWMNKGYDKPVENHLPNRKPLQLPIDPDVVKDMNGFEFGSVEQITEELHYLISSAEYQSAIKTLETQSRHTFTGPSSSNMHHPANILKRRSFNHAVIDLQSIPAAYHPLISVYYLVKERKERELVTASNIIEDKPVFNNSAASHTSSLDSSSSKTLIRRVGYSYTADGKYEVHNPTEQEEAKIQKSILSEEMSTKIQSRHGRKSSDSSKDTMFHRLSRRLSRQLDNFNVSSHDRSDPIVQQSEEDSSPRVAVNGLIVPTIDDSKEHPSLFTDTSSTSCTKSDVRTGSKFNRFLKRATSITVKDLPSVQTNKNADDEEQPRRKSVHHSVVANEEGKEEKSRTSNDGFLAPPPPATASNRSERNRKSPLVNTTTKSLDQAYGSIRSVYLRGLFSVSNTSTKKPAAIRNEIVSVLDKRPDIQYRETKDRFECYISKLTTHEPRNLVTLFDHSSEGNGWDIKNPNSVRFDIYIVKIPWLLSIRGIQFRRISGDPWYYRDTCTQILNVLHL